MEETTTQQTTPQTPATPGTPPQQQQKRKKTLLITLALVFFLLIGLVYFIQSNKILFSSETIYVNGQVQSANAKQLVVETNQGKSVAVNLTIPSEIKVISMAIPKIIPTATRSASALPSSPFNETKPDYISKQKKATTADIETGNTVRIIQKKSFSRIISQEIVVLQ